MKKISYKIASMLLAVVMLSSCGNGFLDTEYTGGVDSEDAYSSVSNIEVALNGAYNRLADDEFAGAYTTIIGDIASDLGSHSSATTHYLSHFNYTILATDGYLESIWSTGYRIIDMCSKIIEAHDNFEDTDYEDLIPTVAQAYALRAYAHYQLVNIFAVAYKVEGATITDNGSQPGIVVVDSPVELGSTVTRSTIAQTYTAINSDIDDAIALFNQSAVYSGTVMNRASTYALKARVALMACDYETAITAADNALAAASSDLGKDGSLFASASAMISAYASVADNCENITYIVKSVEDNLSAYSLGTAYGDYGLSYNSTLTDMLSASDMRAAAYSEYAGKYAGASGNPAVANVRVFAMPELYLIKAEANIKKSSADVAAAQEALLVVASRDTDIASTSDLPSTVEDLDSFIQDERARELFYEGHRVYDLRRWGNLVTVTDGKYTNFDISKFSCPIPSSEINSGYGVEQTENWSSYLPK
ncbi:MAG: RagB/SusD family nutrient uptake outer membrane protein [Rikenellaceae bacterium]